MMKNKLFPILFAFPVTTGVCGAILRASQFRNAFDSETGILKSGEPVTFGLVAVCIIATLMAVIAAFLLKRGIEIKSDKFESLLTAAMSVSAVVILAHAGMIFFALRDEFDVTRLILALFSVYCAVSLLVMGKYRMAERDSTAYCVFSAVPVFWACFMLILTFREKISDPIIANYVPLIFSYICILFFTYAMAAHILGKNKKHIAVFACFLGLFFILTELISPFLLQGSVTFDAAKISEFLPQLAFLILMPAVCTQIVRK